MKAARRIWGWLVLFSGVCLVGAFIWRTDVFMLASMMFTVGALVVNAQIEIAKERAGTTIILKGENR